MPVITKVLGWLLGLFFLFISLVAMIGSFTGKQFSFLSGVFLCLGSLVLLPPIASRFIERPAKTHWGTTTAGLIFMKSTLFVVCFALFAVTTPSVPESKTVPPRPSAAAPKPVVVKNYSVQENAAFFEKLLADGIVTSSHLQEGWVFIDKEHWQKKSDIDKEILAKRLFQYTCQKAPKGFGKTYGIWFATQMDPESNKVYARYKPELGFIQFDPPHNTEILVHRTALAEQEKGIQELIKHHLIGKIEPEYSRVYVDPDFWSTLNIDQKQEFMAGMAFYFGRKSDIEERMPAHVYDFMSGKELASWDPLMGFQVK